MKTLIICCVCSSLLVSTANGQVSESTADWPDWQKVALGVLAGTSVLSTILTIGLNNSESNAGESDSEQGGGGINDEGPGEQGAGALNRKAQGYIEELKDELLIIVQESKRLTENDQSDEEAMAALAEDYPVLMNYYRELSLHHPEVIKEANRLIEGDNTIDRLNTVMMVHLFGAGDRQP
jgi:hypothetical protein